MPPNTCTSSTTKHSLFQNLHKHNRKSPNCQGRSYVTVPLFLIQPAQHPGLQRRQIFEVCNTGNINKSKCVTVILVMSYVAYVWHKIRASNFRVEMNKRGDIKIGHIYVLGIKCGSWVNITNKTTAHNFEVISDKSELVFT